MKTKLPIFRAGQYVRLNTNLLARQVWGMSSSGPQPAGWRRLTHEEQQDWYEAHRKEVAAGQALPFDSAGESVLAPQDVYIDVHPDRVYEIVRGRVSASRGYGKQPGSCLVRCLLTGEEFYMRRDALTPA